MKIYIGTVVFRPSGETIEVRTVASRFAVASSRAVDQALQKRNMPLRGAIERIELDLRCVGPRGTQE